VTIRSRYQHSLAIVRAVLHGVPLTANRAECEARLFSHYPYGQRAGASYTAWRKAVRFELEARERAALVTT
jgi:hypothetical protein